MFLVLLFPKSAYMCVFDQDNTGELDTDRQEELKRVRKREEEEEEKGRKSALLFGSEDTFDSIASLEEKVSILSDTFATVISCCHCLSFGALVLSLLENVSFQFQFVCICLILIYHK